MPDLSGEGDSTATSGSAPPPSSSGTIPTFNLGGGTTTTTGSKSGGSTSGRSGGGSTATNPLAAANARASAEALLRAWGLPFSLADWAMSRFKQGASEQLVVNELYQRPEFKAKFPGIFASDGRLRMSPQDYLAYGDQARRMGEKFGYKLSSAEVGKLVSGGVSVQELQFRFNGAEAVKQNAHLFSSFNEILKGAGLPQIKTAADAFKFFTGQSERRVYAAYEQASVVAGAKSAGLKVDYADAVRIAGTVPGTDLGAVQDYEKGFKEIADQLRLAGPEIMSFGLSQRDLETIEFGGPQRAQLAAKAEQALKQRQAALTQPQAQTAVRLSPSGQPTTVGYEKQAGL